MKKGWVVLNVLCIGIACMMMTSCTGIFQQKKIRIFWSMWRSVKLDI